MWVAAPSHLILITGRQAQVDLHLLLPFSGQPTLGTLPSSRSRPTPPPCPSHCATNITGARRGTSASQPWPRRPGPGPGQGSRTRSREQAQGSGVRAAAAVGPEHGTGHSFLWKPPAAALGPRWPVASPSPPCESPPPSPRRHSHRCLASRRGLLPLGPRPAAGAPGYTSPSSGPWSGIRRWVP